MKTLNKFIIKSYLGPMVMTFFIVTFILMLNFLWRYIDELVGKGLPMSVIAELIFYATSTLIPMGLPLATLLAAIMTMGNLGENNELLALKSAGVSLQKIIRSIVLVALLISIGSFFIINNFVPFSYMKSNNLLFDIRQQRQQIEFKDGIFFDGIPNIAIRVDKRDKETHLLTGVLIYDNRDVESPNTIVADSGYINMSNNKEFLQVRLFNGQTYEGNRSFSWYDNPTLSHHTFDFQELLIQLDGFSFKRTGGNAFGDESAAKNMVALNKDIDSLTIVAERKISEFSNTVLSKYMFSYDTTIMNMTDSIRKIKRHEINMKNVGFDTLSIESKSEILNQATTSLNNLKYFASSEHDNIRETTVSLYGALINLHKKLSLPVSILIFFLIGAPLGAIIRKGGLGMPIVI
ncbi:MAG: LptF/LptG family permease, partial [Rikenellaceae bacterium]